MISSDWEMPDKEISNFNDSFVAVNQIQDEIKSNLDKILASLSKKLSEKQYKQLSLFDDQLIYEPNGKIPFPKNFDLDDKEVPVFANDQKKIEHLLSQYGIVCSGAESVEITKDISDPFLTVITIKKTIF